MNYYLIFTVYNFANFCAALFRQSVSLVIHKDQQHTGTEYKTFHVNVKQECGEKCIADLSCLSFNLYNTSDGLQCSLMGEILEDGELIDKQNTDFYGK